MIHQKRAVSHNPLPSSPPGRLAG